MTYSFLVNAPGWAAMRALLVHSLWQGPLVLALALLGEALARKRPRVAFALSFGSLLLLPVLATATYRGAFDALSGVFASSFEGNLLREPLQARSPSSPDWASIITVTGWASIAALFIIRSVVTEWHSRHRLLESIRAVDALRQRRFAAMSKRVGLRRSVRIVASPEIDVPLAFGWLHPVVVLPQLLLAKATEDQVELLLLHELVHIRSGDYPMVLLQHLLRCSFFHNPAVWQLMKVIDQQRELACDRGVLDLRVDPRRYAAALVELEGLRQGAMGVSAGGGDLLWRVRAILDVRSSASAGAWRRWAAVLGLAAVGFSAVGCAGGGHDATGDYADAFTVELFKGHVTLVNGLPVPEGEIAARASHADKNTPALIRADAAVEVDRILDVLASLKREGLTRVAFARTGDERSE